MTPAEREAEIAQFKELKYLYERAVFSRKPFTIMKLREKRSLKRVWYGSEEDNLRIKIDKLLTDPSIVTILNRQ